MTLVELLVVTAIVGGLVSLLLPAVQSARESSRAAACLNHLRQIGLAIQLHEQAIRGLPPGNFATRAGICTGGTSTGNANPSQDHVNWAILILPYLEQQPLYAMYDFSTSNEAPENRGVRESLVNEYLCPSDPVPRVPAVPGFGPAAAWDLNVPYMPGSYRAVSGTSDGREFLDHPQVNMYPRAWRGPMHIVGILGFRRETLRQIKDGTSHTWLVGESITRSKAEYGTMWAYSHAFFSLSATVPQSRTRWGDYERCRRAGGVGMGLPCARGWGSHHPSGIPFVACDGSARIVTEDIDDFAFAAAGSIAGDQEG